MRLKPKCVESTADTAPTDEGHVQEDDEVEAKRKPMDTPPTLAIASNPGPVQPVHPLRSLDFWYIEILIVLLGVSFTFSRGAAAWTMWREGTRITGPSIAAKDVVGNGERELVTVRDPATELGYTALMKGHDHDIGTLATVIVHPTDRSKVWTPTTVYIRIALSCAFLVTTIAYPIAAMIVHRRGRSR